MRLFVALDVPVQVRGEVLDAVDHARAAAPDALAWSDPERWHLTLAFLGDVDDRVRTRLEPRLAAVAARYPPLRLRVRGGGRFGGRVLWAGVEEAGPDGGPADEDPAAAPSQLHRLADSVAAAARRVGVAQEERGYRPHLTLGRARGPADLRPVADALSALSSRVWKAEVLLLVASRPGPRPVHETVAGFPLTAPGA